MAEFSSHSRKLSIILHAETDEANDDELKENEDEQMRLGEGSSGLKAQPEENEYYIDDNKLVIPQLPYCDIEEVEDCENEQDQAELMDFYDGRVEDTEIMPLNIGGTQQSQQSVGNQFVDNNISGEIDPLTTFSQFSASLNGVRVENNHICQECGASFQKKINLQRHITTKHCQISPSKCDLCTQVFGRKQDLRRHLLSVHAGLKYTCEFCGRDVSRKYLLDRHIRRAHPTDHLGIPPEPIDAKNGESLSMSSSQAAGFKISEKALQSMQPKLPKPKMPKKRHLSCDMCDATFTQLNDLHEHQSDVHRDVRKYKCSECPKAFKQKRHLKGHAVVHTGEKKFKCTLCGNSFTRKHSVQEHIRRMHGKDPIENVDFQQNAIQTLLITIPSIIIIVPILILGQSEPSQLQPTSSSLWSSAWNYDTIPTIAEAQPQHFSCNQCQVVFSDEKMYQIHLKNAH